MKETSNGPQKCPYCGTLLMSRYAIRQHLTLRVCTGEPDFPKCERDIELEKSDSIKKKSTS
jgi:hypothetical protein